MTGFIHIIALKPAFMINKSALNTFLENMIGNNADDMVEAKFPIVEISGKHHYLVRYQI